MFNKIFYFIKRHKSRGKCTLKQEKGISLVEVIVAILIISIITVVLVRGTITAVNVSKMNRAKTLSSAVASEKLELIKCLDYDEDIVITGTPEWNDWLSGHPELFEVDEYDIDYNITWVAVGEDPEACKQVEISVSKENMNMKSISVITQIYPTKGPEEKSKYPPPENLTIKSDTGSGLEWKRKIELVWKKPVPSSDPDLDIYRYHIYRDDEAVPIAWCLPTSYTYTDSYAGDNEVHSYYVRAVYSDGVLSRSSNKDTTEYLRITHYKPTGGAKRTVWLAWGEAADIGIEFVGFVVYRIDEDGVEISTPVAFDKSYDDKIGFNNYTYYVTAKYEDDEGNIIESDPSNEVTTE